MRRLTILGISLIALACADPAAPGDVSGPPFAVRDTLFQLDSLPQFVRVEIPYRLVNVSGRTLYVDNCLDGVRLERQVADSNWTTAWQPIVACAQAAPRPLAPNDSVVGLLQVFGDLAPGDVARFDIPTDTLWHFRLRLPLYNANGTAIPAGPQTLSTTFTINP